jgi:hypothetical protein
MPLRVAGRYIITFGGTGTVAGGVAGVSGTFSDQSLQGKTDSDVAVGDYLSVTLPDQSTWRWRITVINSVSPLNIDVVFDDDDTGFPVVFAASPIIPSTAAIAGRMSPTAVQSFIPSFSTYQIQEQLQAGLFAEGGGAGITPVTGWVAQVDDGSGPLPDRNLELETLQDTARVLQTLINDLRTAGILTS